VEPEHTLQIPEYVSKSNPIVESATESASLAILPETNNLDTGRGGKVPTSSTSFRFAVSRPMSNL